MSSKRGVHSLRTLFPQPRPPSLGTPPQGTARQGTATLTTSQGSIPSDQHRTPVDSSPPPSLIDSRGSTPSAAARTSLSPTGSLGLTPLTVPRTSVVIAVGSLPSMTLTPSVLLDPSRSLPRPQRRVRTTRVHFNPEVIKHSTVRWIYSGVVFYP